MSRPAATSMPARSSRAFWMRHLHRWHWISSAISLIGMILFAVTGITLNHAADIPATPQVTERSAVMPPSLRETLASLTVEDRAPLPPALREWVRGALGVRAGATEAEWSEDEIYLSLPRPGGDASLTIDRASGEAVYERTTRGTIAFLNDLHKGRHAGVAWSWFIDVFAAACVIFCVTGLVLLWLHAGTRPSTWPMVGLGLVVPALLIILFIH